MKRCIILLLVLFALPDFANGEVVGKEVTYSENDTKLIGYLAYQKGLKVKRPGILVVHEWWGHNAYARHRADMLAELGYTALAVDMYGDGKQASHPEDAGKFSAAVKQNMPVAVKRFNAALALLKKQPTVDPTKIAAIGYCFGGGIVLEMARQGFALDGVVSFHGSLTTSSPAKKGAVIAKILVLNGADDPFVKKEQIEAFKDEMDAAGADYRFISYRGAKHSFTNPGSTELGKKFNLPLEYNEEADKKSWAEMLTFFDRLFKK